jgi:broad-specificity NMP kinase
MSAPIESEAEWHEFVDPLVEIFTGARAELKPESRLIEDLGVDSLALAELIIVLVERYDPASLSRRLDERAWEEVTLGMLFQECKASDPGVPSRRVSSTA